MDIECSMTKLTAATVSFWFTFLNFFLWLCTLRWCKSHRFFI